MLYGPRVQDHVRTCAYKKEGSREEVEDLEWKAEREPKAQTEEATERAYRELDFRSTAGKAAMCKLSLAWLRRVGSGRGQDLGGQKEGEILGCCVPEIASHEVQGAWRDKRNYRGSQVGLGDWAGAQGLETGRRVGRREVVCANISPLACAHIKGIRTERTGPRDCLPSALAMVICDYYRALLTYYWA